MKSIASITAAVVLVCLLGAAAWLWTPDKPLRTLEAKYLRSPDDMIEVAGPRLHVRDDGPRTAPVERFTRASGHGSLHAPAFLICNGAAC